MTRKKEFNDKLTELLIEFHDLSNEELLYGLEWAKFQMMMALFKVTSEYRGEE